MFRALRTKGKRERSGLGTLICVGDQECMFFFWKKLLVKNIVRRKKNIHTHERARGEARGGAGCASVV